MPFHRDWGASAAGWGGQGRPPLRECCRLSVIHRVGRSRAPPLRQNLPTGCIQPAFTMGGPAQAGHIGPALRRGLCRFTGWGIGGGTRAAGASDTPRRMSGLWSQCHWDRRRPLRCFSPLWVQVVAAGAIHRRAMLVAPSSVSFADTFPPRGKAGKTSPHGKAKNHPAGISCPAG